MAAEISSTIARARAIAKRDGWPAMAVRTEADAQAVLDGGCYFDRGAADKVVRFFPEFLHHCEGRWAGDPFTLAPWQRDQVVRPIFGWKRADGTRRYRRGGIWVPKKNGKTTLAAGICLYMLVADHEPGTKVFSAATDRSQAAFIYGIAEQMVRHSPELASVLGYVKSTKTISYIAENGMYKALSADVPTKEGLNIHCLIADELHAWENRNLWSTLAYGGEARRQPLILSISTAGIYRPTSIGWEQYTYAKRVVDGATEDWSFFALIYEADPAADWTQPAVWKAANPSYGITVRKDGFAEECHEAQESPAKQNDFLRYRLNIWVQQNTRAIDLKVWDENNPHPIPLVDVRDKRPWYGGLDLGGSSDLSAWLMIAPCEDDPEAVDVRCRFWLPEATLTGKHPNAGLYQQWAKSGHLTVTPGNIADERFIQAQIVEDKAQCNLVSGNIDRAFQGLRLTLELAEQGVTLLPMGQGFLSMAAPTKLFLDLVAARRFHHGGHPILRFMADNVVLRKDPAGNNKVDKEKSAQKVDGIVAAVMALDGFSRAAPKVEPAYTMLVLGGRP